MYYLSFVLLSCLLVCGLYSCGSDARYVKRDTENNENFCSRSTPCGWEIYTPYERRFLEFVQSPCECPTGSRCTRSSDDISLSAYVHRCIPSGIAAEQWSYDSAEK